MQQGMVGTANKIMVVIFKWQKHIPPVRVIPKWWASNAKLCVWHSLLNSWDHGIWRVSYSHDLWFKTQKCQWHGEHHHLLWHGCLVFAHCVLPLSCWLLLQTWPKESTAYHSVSISTFLRISMSQSLWWPCNGPGGLEANTDCCSHLVAAVLVLGFLPPLTREAKLQIQTPSLSSRNCISMWQQQNSHFLLWLKFKNWWWKIWKPLVPKTEKDKNFLTTQVLSEQNTQSQQWKNF